MRSSRTVQIATIAILIVIPFMASAQDIPAGTLQISSTPPGAEVFLNNTAQGYTPLIIRNVTSGPYTVTLTLTGYQVREADILVKSGAVTMISMNLTQAGISTTGVTHSPIRAGFSITVYCAALFGISFLASRRRI